METDQQKISYIIGRQIGGDFQKQGIQVAFEEFYQGVKSSYLGEASELSDEESHRVMSAFQERMQAAQAELSQTRT